jgi:hypothetical protein
MLNAAVVLVQRTGPQAQPGGTDRVCAGEWCGIVSWCVETASGWSLQLVAPKPISWRGRASVMRAPARSSFWSRGGGRSRQGPPGWPQLRQAPVQRARCDTARRQWRGPSSWRPRTRQGALSCLRGLAAAQAWPRGVEAGEGACTALRGDAPACLAWAWSGGAAPNYVVYSRLRAQQQRAGAAARARAAPEGMRRPRAARRRAARVAGGAPVAFQAGAHPSAGEVR